MSKERRRVLNEALDAAEPYPESMFKKIYLDGPHEEWDIDPARMRATLAKRELDGTVPIPQQYLVPKDETAQ